MEYAITIIALIVVFTIATVRPINMGLLALVAAFLVGSYVSGIDLEEVQTYFPADLFFIVVGITLLFGAARANGTVDIFMRAALKLVRGKRWAIVWLMFFIAALLMAFGSVLAVAMLAPIAMPLAKKHGIDPLLMGMMISHGALGAAFSPVTVYSVAIGELVDEQGVDISPLLLFVVPFLLNLIFAAILFFWRGRDLFKGSDEVTPDEILTQAGHEPLGTSGPSAPVAAAAPGGGSTASTLTTSRTGSAPTASQAQVAPAESGASWVHYVTFAAIIALLASALFEMELGPTSITLGALLLLIAPSSVEAATKSIAWAAVLLVCGVTTYMGVAETNGTLNYLGEKAVEIPWPLLTAFVMFLAVGIISAVGSSFGIILITLPLATPLIEAGQLGAAGFVVALSFCATVVDVSPFSTNGVIVLASAQVDDRAKFQRQMLAYTGLVIVVAPLIATLAVVWPTT